MEIHLYNSAKMNSENRAVCAITIICIGQILSVLKKFFLKTDFKNLKTVSRKNFAKKTIFYTRQNNFYIFIKKIVHPQIIFLIFIFIFFGVFMKKRLSETNSLPTDFAIEIAEKFKIYEEVPEKDFVELMKREEKLKMFQQMAISSSFEESLLAYYDRDFSPEQLQALKLIYRATASWLRGEVVGVLITKIQNSRITNKDFADSISKILDQLENVNDNTGERTPTKQTNGLAIKLAKS